VVGKNGAKENAISTWQFTVFPRILPNPAALFRYHSEFPSFFSSHFPLAAEGTLKLAKDKCRWANICPKDLAWASLMCAWQDDGRVLGRVIYLVIWYFRGSKLKLRQSVGYRKLETSDIFKYVSKWFLCSPSGAGVWSTWSCIEFLWVFLFFVVMFWFAKNRVQSGRVV